MKTPLPLLVVQGINWRLLALPVVQGINNHSISKAVPGESIPAGNIYKFN